MPGFDAWDIVKVPFPYTDRPIRQRRPALVIAARDLEEAHGLLWLAMITSAANRAWSGDVVISDLHLAGLPAPSLVRPAKIVRTEFPRRSRSRWDLRVVQHVVTHVCPRTSVIARGYYRVR